MAFRSFPPAPSVPEDLRGRTFVALRGCHCGDLEQGRALVEQARTVLGPAEVDTFAVIPAAALASVSMDPIDPLPVLGHTELLTELTPAAIDAVLAVAGPGSGSPLVMFELRRLGGALVGPPDALSPMAHTSAMFSVNAIGITPAAEQEQAVRAHLAWVASELAPHVTGERYINFLDLDAATQDRVRSAYSPADFERLLAIKRAYDPADIFRFNRNVLDPHHER